jgi:hypothetical protein
MASMYPGLFVGVPGSFDIYRTLYCNGHRHANTGKDFLFASPLAHHEQWPSIALMLRTSQLISFRSIIESNSMGDTS